MTWRVAESLKVLRAECDLVAPNRSRGYDGTLGDAAHAARASRHNPNDAGVVCALDITHDPAHGMDTYDLFDWLRLHPHPDLAYVISNRHVARRTSGWVVKVYTGANAHDKHIHVAVGVGPDSEPRPPYDDLDSWRLREWKGQEDDDMTPEQDRTLKLIRVSMVAQSNDQEIAIAIAEGNITEAKRLKAEAEQQAQTERARLGV